MPFLIRPFRPFPAQCSITPQWARRMPQEPLYRGERNSPESI